MKPAQVTALLIHRLLLDVMAQLVELVELEIRQQQELKDEEEETNGERGKYG